MKTSWNKGKHLSQEHRDNLSKAQKNRFNGRFLHPMLGKKHSKETKKHWSDIRKGKPNPHSGISPSLEHRLKLSEAIRGEKNYHWRGGITSLRNLIRRTFKYRQWRSDIFTRDDWTCVNCCNRGCYLEVDHFPKMFAEILIEYKITTVQQADDCQELWDINNGRTLCRECHKNIGKRKVGTLG